LQPLYPGHVGAVSGREKKRTRFERGKKKPVLPPAAREEEKNRERPFIFWRERVGRSDLVKEVDPEGEGKGGAKSRTRLGGWEGRGTRYGRIDHFQGARFLLRGLAWRHGVRRGEGGHSSPSFRVCHVGAGGGPRGGEEKRVSWRRLGNGDGDAYLLVLFLA